MISGVPQTDVQFKGIDKDSVPRRLNYRLPRYFIYLVIIAYVTLSLLPLISSGFYSDDLVNSTLKGQLALRNISFLDYYLETVKTWATSNGRFLPVALFITSAMSYLLYDVLVYKVIVLVLVVINVFLFGWLVEEVTGNRYISFWAMLAVPLLFQFRLYHDPILSHYGAQQIYLSLVFCSIIYFNRFMQTNKYSCLLLSLISYNILLYSSELSVALICLYAAVVVNSEGNEKYRALGRRLWPFILSVLISIASMIITKALMTKTAQGYSGARFNLDIVAIVRSLEVQLYATLPLSYYLSNPSRLFQITVNGFIGNVHLIDMLGLLMLLATYLYVAKNINGVYRKNSAGMMASIGVILTVLPAFVISLSEKYQKEIHFGIGYIQVYIQYFGAVLTGVALFVYFHYKLRNRQLQYALHFGVVIVFSAIYMVNAQNNRLVIEKSNIDMHYRRSALITALSDDILGNVPENSVIYIKDEYSFDLYPQVYSDTRAWVEYGYAWKTAALVYQYAKKKMNVVTEPGELKSFAAGSNYGLPEPDNLYLLNIKSYPGSSGDRTGFVILSKIGNLQLDKDGVVHFQSQPLASRFPKEKG